MSTISVINQLKSILKNNKEVVHLKKYGVLEWLFAERTFINNLTAISEKEWGQQVSGNTGNQWTTKFGEELLSEILMLLNKNPKRIKVAYTGTNGKKLLPDYETDFGLYENKARTFTTSGTAGEKILGTPMKYCECIRLYKKPLFIVCMAFQEIEADVSFQLFNPKSKELQTILNFYNEMGISFVRTTDLLREYIKLNDSAMQI